MQKLIVAVIAGMVMALGAVAPSVSAPAAPGLTAQASAATAACSLPLNPNRRMVYKLKNGASTLSYARVVYTATQQNRHRYCIRFQTGGRIVTHSWGRADYPRLNGVCGTKQLGAMGSGTYRTGSYQLDLTVRDKTCVFQGFAIKRDGKWFATPRIMRYNA